MTESLSVGDLIVRDYACPLCAAERGARCRVVSGYRRESGVHRQRLDLWYDARLIAARTRRGEVAENA